MLLFQFLLLVGVANCKVTPQQKSNSAVVKSTVVNQQVKPTDAFHATTAAPSELTQLAAKTLLTQVAALMNVESKKSGIDLDLTQKVALYGLFTQATKGNAPKKSPHAIWDFEGGIKFQSWESFKGKSPAECVAEYKKIALEVFPKLVFA